MGSWPPPSLSQAAPPHTYTPLPETSRSPPPPPYLSQAAPSPLPESSRPPPPPPTYLSQAALQYGVQAAQEADLIMTSPLQPALSDTHHLLRHMLQGAAAEGRLAAGVGHLRAGGRGEGGGAGCGGVMAAVWGMGCGGDGSSVGQGVWG